MEKFEELQALWRGQAAASGPPAEELMQKVHGHTRKHLAIYAFKAAFVTVIAATMLYTMRESPLVLGGVLMTLAGAAVMIGVEWMAHRSIARLEFTAPSAGFARAAAVKLRRLARPQPVQYAALILGPLAGLNLCEYVLLGGVQWPRRVLIHAGFSVMLVVAAWAGFQIRARRYDRETRPLLERLEAFETANDRG